MAIVFTDILGGQRPERSSCAWPTTDVRYWRNANAAGFLRLQLRSFDSGGGRGPIYGVRGGWWSGVVLDPLFGTCGGSDPLISFFLGAEAYIYLDVWRALSQGLWTSSTVIECIPVNFNGASRNAGIFLGPETGPSPPTIGALYKSVPWPGSCSNGVAWTITVRDDGTCSVV